MAGRPQKTTVDYFPHDAVPGKTIFILKSRFKHAGYATWFQLLALLCRTPGHCYDCRPSENWEFLLAEMALSDGELLDVLNCLGKIHAIDDELWQHKLIWSQNLVNRLAGVYRERSTPIPTRPELSCLQLDITNPKTDIFDITTNQTTPQLDITTPFLTENTNSLTENIGGDTISSEKMTHSKLNETTVNKREENNNTVLPDGVDEGLWYDFLEMRKTKRLPPTARALKLLMSTLEKLQAAGDDPNAVLEQSIMCGWTGLFPLKLREKSAKPIPGGTPSPDKYLKQRYGHMVQR